ncbi:hypothetical protein ANCCAN_20910 [Ancylostoma caninum]|uniref:MARVEL domain-containing protein n=1 Tax=Ancylostoma caninum TaxID=29170 RepID=A0A368FR09_ANCCA|nr:hypothetical protein ANCCAN_20910 [Ancylostoma caninum]
MKNSDHTDRGVAAFPHYHPRYKCCCDTVHVKQGTLMIGIVSAIFALFGLFQALFSSSENLKWTILEVLYLAIEGICTALLFVAIFKDKKMLLIPFFLNQLVSALLCAMLTLLFIWALIDSDNFVGEIIKVNNLSVSITVLCAR